MSQSSAFNATEAYLTALRDPSKTSIDALTAFRSDISGGQITVSDGSQSDQGDTIAVPDDPGGFDLSPWGIAKDILSGNAYRRLFGSGNTAGTTGASWLSLLLFFLIGLALVVLGAWVLAKGQGKTVIQLKGPQPS